MIDMKRRKHLGFFMAIALLFLVGIFGCGTKDQDPADDPLNEENGREEDPAPKEEEAGVEEEDPYVLAEEIVPIDDRNIAMDEDFRSALEEIFEKEPKLVNAGEILALSYVVDRTITGDDVTEMKALLEERGYGLVGTKIEEDRYELNVSAEILDQYYNGNIYVMFFTAQEGEHAQNIDVKIL